MGIQAGLMDWDDNQRYQSVDSAGGQTINPEDSQYNDPETAEKIRASIQDSNKQKSLYQYHSNSFPMLHSVSTVSKNFREIIRNKSVPQLESIEYSTILTQYEYDMDG